MDGCQHRCSVNSIKNENEFPSEKRQECKEMHYTKEKPVDLIDASVTSDMRTTKIRGSDFGNPNKVLILVDPILANYGAVADSIHHYKDAWNNSLSRHHPKLKQVNFRKLSKGVRGKWTNTGGYQMIIIDPTKGDKQVDQKTLAHGVLEHELAHVAYDLSAPETKQEWEGIVTGLDPISDYVTNYNDNLPQFADETHSEFVRMMHEYFNTHSGENKEVFEALKPHYERLFGK